MKKPNDKKRPKTNSGAEDRERKRNLGYFWVSKPILQIKDDKTGLVHKIAHPKGNTYRKPKP